jgi:hypothetical protein
MKKNLFFVGIAAAAMLASCSNDETMDVARNSQAIQFNSFVNKTTRATDIDNSNFKAFQVWGLMEKDGQTGKPFEGTEVTNPSGSGWSYATPVYWEDGYKYSFVAIAPAATGDNCTFTAPTAVGQWGSIAFNNGNGTTDLIYDIDDTYASSPVTINNQRPAAINFTLNHMLSRVKFAFQNVMDDGSDINVTDVKITNANVKATAALGENVTWTLADDNTPAPLDFGNVVLDDETTSFAGNETKETDHKYMIPVMNEGQTYTVQFKVTRTHHGVTDEYDHEVSLPSVDWAAGNSYAFVAKLGAKNIDPDNPNLYKIEFTAEVGEWGKFNDPATELPVEPVE